jgi:hypothetical protein
MKNLLITATLTAFAACNLHAKDEKAPAIPKEKEGRWGIYSYAEAKEEAAKKKRPIAYLVQDERAEEASEKEATNKAFWGVAKDCTMVVIPSRLVAEAKNRCGEAVFAALTTSDIGKDSPRMAVLDQTGEKYLGHMNKDALIAADEKVLKAFAKQVEDLNKDPSKAPALPVAAAAKPAAKPADAPPAPAPATAGPVTIKDPKPENWTNAQGRTIQATLLEVNGDTAMLQLANGTKVPIGVSTLSADSQKRVEELKAASAK